MMALLSWLQYKSDFNMPEYQSGLNNYMNSTGLSTEPWGIPGVIETEANLCKWKQNDIYSISDKTLKPGIV